MENLGNFCPPRFRKVQLAFRYEAAAYRPGDEAYLAAMCCCEATSLINIKHEPISADLIERGGGERLLRVSNTSEEQLCMRCKGPV